MKQRACFTFLLILLTEVTFSQSKIEGFAYSYRGKNIALYQYSDYITNTEQIQKQTKIQADGKFSFNFNPEKPFLGLLKIEDVNALIYLEPASNYQIVFPEKELSQTRPYTQQHYVSLELLDNNPMALHNAIIKFKAEYDDFVAEHFMAIFNKRAKTIADTFILGQKALYAGLDSSYFTDYLKYSLATLELDSYHPRQDLYQKYLDNKTVLYGNDAYMVFFYQFYYKYLRSLFLTSLEKPIKHALEKKGSYTLAMQTLSSADFLQDHRVRELFLLMELYEMYPQKEFPKKNILSVLDTIRFSSSYNEHRLIAHNAIKKITRFETGSMAPDFTLRNREMQPVSLHDLKGKFVYLYFWAPWCSSCPRDMNTLESIKEKSGKDFEFLCIMLSEDSTSFKEVNLPKGSLTFLNGNDQKQIKDSYDIRAIPSFFMIDKQGNFLHQIMYPPGEKLEQSIFELIRQSRTDRDSKWDSPSGKP